MLSIPLFISSKLPISQDIYIYIYIYVCVCVYVCMCVIYNNNNYKQYPRIESSSLAYLVQWLSKLIVRVQCKVHQQTIRWNGNLGRISKSENVRFQMVTEKTMLFDNLSCSVTEFKIVRTPTEKARVPV